MNDKRFFRMYYSASELYGAYNHINSFAAVEEILFLVWIENNAKDELGYLRPMPNAWRERYEAIEEQLQLKYEKRTAYDSLLKPDLPQYSMDKHQRSCRTGDRSFLNRLETMILTES